MFDGYLGTQKNLYTEEAWELTHDHVTALAELEVPAPQDPQRYQVWLQTGDETLDYRLALSGWRKEVRPRIIPHDDKQDLSQQLLCVV